jgi:UDP-glucose 4-epimerase
MTASGSIVRSARRGRVVALTGACSFLGTNLIHLLEDDEAVARVVAIDTRRPPRLGHKTRHYHVDLTLRGATDRVAEILAADGVETLVHLAFLSSPTPAASFSHELESIGTLQLLQGASQTTLAQLILASQTWLYGAQPDNPSHLDETRALRAPAGEPFFADKIAAEQAASRFGEQHPETCVTVLRSAPIVGATVHNFMTRYLEQRVKVTLLGFDPLLQFVHEVDVVAAFKAAIDRAVHGTFNIVGDHVLPLSKVLARVGGTTLPLPHPAAQPLVATMWAGKLGPWPPGFVPFLRYPCVGDGLRAAEELDFVAACTSEEALADFVRARELRQRRPRRASEANP